MTMVAASALTPKKAKPFYFIMDEDGAYIIGTPVERNIRNSWSVWLRGTYAPVEGEDLEEKNMQEDGTEGDGG